jgi:hypothetical protein
MIAGFALNVNKWDSIYVGRRKGKELVYVIKVDQGFDDDSAKQLRACLTLLIHKSQPILWNCAPSSVRRNGRWSRRSISTTTARLGRNCSPGFKARSASAPSWTFCASAVWGKWEGRREEITKAAACCWIPTDDLMTFRNRLPGTHVGWPRHRSANAFAD